jgi:hypothetical protein
MLDTTQYPMAIYFYMYGAFDTTHIFVVCLQGKVLSHYFTTKKYRIKRFSGVHACVHGADALTHTLSATYWEMVMIRKQDTLIL